MRTLTDRATRAAESNIGYDAVLNSDRNADLVAAEWVMSVGGKCGWV
jgi:hypothetical protein